MARSVWKGPYIDRHLLKIYKMLSDHKDEKNVQRANLALERVAKMKTTTPANKQSGAGSEQHGSQKLAEQMVRGQRVWSRKSVVLPNLVGLTLQIYNGKKFIPVKITQEMIGHKLGEFSPTRIISFSDRSKSGDTRKKKR